MDCYSLGWILVFSHCKDGDLHCSRYAVIDNLKQLILSVFLARLTCI